MAFLAGYADSAIASASFTIVGSWPTSVITVLASPSNGGAVSGGGTYPVDSSQQISATPTNGWTFVGWSDGNTQTNRTITVSSTNTTYTANFRSPWQADQLACGPDGNVRLLWRHFANGQPDGWVSVWRLDSNAVFQSAVNTSNGPWSVKNMVVSPYDSSMHLAWTNTNAGAIWSYDGSGTGIGSKTLFIADWGWSLLQFDIGAADGNQRYLSQKADGSVAVCTHTNYTDNGGSVFYYGPYSPWQARVLRIGATDNIPRLLWENTDHSLSIWTLDSNGGYQSAVTLTPPSGWQGVDFKLGLPDSRQHLVWQHTSGMVSLWTLNSSSVFESAATFGPYTNWTVVAQQVRPDGKKILEWADTTGKVSLWQWSAGNGFERATTVGPYTGWSLQDTVVDSVNRMYLLWVHTSGMVSIWRLSATGGFELAVSYGPY
jgi:uncharacterized repeat protein (TIGR02543 family)